MYFGLHKQKYRGRLGILEITVDFCARKIRPQLSGNTRSLFIELEIGKRSERTRKGLFNGPFRRRSNSRWAPVRRRSRLIEATTLFFNSRRDNVSLSRAECVRRKISIGFDLVTEEGALSRVGRAEDGGRESVGYGVSTWSSWVACGRVKSAIEAV